MFLHNTNRIFCIIGGFTDQLFLFIFFPGLEHNLLSGGTSTNPLIEGQTVLVVEIKSYIVFLQWAD